MGVNNYQQKKTPVFFKDNSLVHAVLAVMNRIIVKAYLHSIFTNDLKRKFEISENVHNCRPSHFKVIGTSTVIKWISRVKRHNS